MYRSAHFSASRAANTPDVSGTRLREILRLLDDRGLLTGHARRQLLNPPCPLNVPLADLLDPPSKRVKKGRVARPQNPFILYRRNSMAVIRPTVGERGRKVVHELSRRTAAMWAQEPLAVVDYFKLLAEVHKEIHRLRYPTYRYHPTRPVRDAEPREPNCTKSPSLDGKAWPGRTQPSDSDAPKDMNYFPLHDVPRSPIPSPASEGTLSEYVYDYGSATTTIHIPNTGFTDGLMMSNAIAPFGFYYWAPFYPATTPIIDPPIDLNISHTTTEDDSPYTEIESTNSDIEWLSFQYIDGHVSM